MSKVACAPGAGGDEIKKPKAKRKFQLTKEVLPEGACAAHPLGAMTTATQHTMSYNTLRRHPPALMGLAAHTQPGSTKTPSPASFWRARCKAPDFPVCLQRGGPSATLLPWDPLQRNCNVHCTLWTNLWPRGCRTLRSNRRRCASHAQPPGAGGSVRAGLLPVRPRAARNASTRHASALIRWGMLQQYSCSLRLAVEQRLGGVPRQHLTCRIRLRYSPRAGSESLACSGQGPQTMCF